jgi:plasmid stability protein
VARTTLALDDDLLRRVKQRAAAEGRSMQSVVNDLLRQALVARGRAPGYRLELQGWHGREQPGVDLFDRDRLFDLMDGRS